MGGVRGGANRLYTTGTRGGLHHICAGHFGFKVHGLVAIWGFPGGGVSDRAKLRPEVSL